MASRISLSTSFSGRWSLISWCVRKPRVLPILMSVFSSWRRLATSSSVSAVSSRPNSRISARSLARETFMRSGLALALPSPRRRSASGSPSSSASTSDEVFLDDFAPPSACGRACALGGRALRLGGRRLRLRGRLRRRGLAAALAAALAAGFAAGLAAAVGLAAGLALRGGLGGGLGGGGLLARSCRSSAGGRLGGSGLAVGIRGSWRRAGVTSLRRHASDTRTAGSDGEPMRRGTRRRGRSRASGPAAPGQARVSDHLECSPCG